MKEFRGLPLLEILQWRIDLPTLDNEALIV